MCARARQDMLHEVGLLTDDVDRIRHLDEMQVLPLESVPTGGIELQYIHFGWHVLTWNLKKMGIDMSKKVAMISSAITRPLFLALQDSRVDIDVFRDLVTTQMRDARLYLLPLWHAGHWTLLVVDRLHGPPGSCAIRYYDSLPDESVRCREHASELLGSLLSLGLLSEASTHEVPVRSNKVQQKADECGFFILAYMEQEAAAAHGFGPAAIGWVPLMARNWHGRLHRVGTQLSAERMKRIHELHDLDKKHVAAGAKMRAERAKLAAVAEKRKAKDETLSHLQQMAWDIEHNNRPLSLDDMPHECHVQLSKIAGSSIGICARCHWRSGCLSCSREHCIGYYMRREGKRLGRIVPEQYRL